MSLLQIADPSAQGKNYEALSKYLNLDQGNQIQAEYIWIGGSGQDMRSKTRTLPKEIKDVKELPAWNYDGSSTGQAKGNYSEIWLQPKKFVRDPFRGGKNILVLCECLEAKSMKPIPTNKRANAAKVFEQKDVIKEVTWFG
eukprot:242789_1